MRLSLWWMTEMVIHTCFTQDLHSVLYKTVCSTSTDWSLHIRNDAVVIRSGSPVAARPASLPAVPDVILYENEPTVTIIGSN